jgi:branched-chain amino acid transport system permease protein
MSHLLSIPLVVWFGQLTLGVVNGAFYALLSLGLAVIFGMLGVVNFAHGAFYAVGAFVAVFALSTLGLNYWEGLVIVPFIVGLWGIAFERLLLRHIYRLEPLYGLLLTFGAALTIEGLLQSQFGSSGLSYPTPAALQGVIHLSFMILPKYRAWVIIFSLVICLTTWYVIEKTRLGATLRAATENPRLLQAMGVNVPLLICLTYGAGVALAALAGCLAAPVILVTPQMGASLVTVVFAVVVIGGMGSILGAIVSGFGLGIIEGLTKVVYPEASNVVVFLIMAIVLMIRPSGLFGKES